MEKIDYKKEYKKIYNPSKKEPEIIDVPNFQFLMIDGIDARPENKEFQSAIEALFSISFKVKFISKNKLNKDYVVMPLEGLWWADDMDNFEKGKKENWKWTLMIMQPNFITIEIIDAAVSELKKKKNNNSINLLRLEKFKEGNSAQIMHIGPFSEEHENILKLHNLIKKKDGKYNGHVQKHHEIYLSDFRKCAPEKLKTILRQPFSR